MSYQVGPSGRLYTLSFIAGGGKEPPKIRVHIFRPCVEHFSRLLEMRDISEKMREWNFGQYEPNLTQGFGFDGALLPAGDDGEYLFLDAPLAEVSATRLAVSLSFLFHTFRWGARDAQSDSARLQLIELESRVVHNEGMQVAPIGGYASPALARWVETQCADSNYVFVPKVAEAIYLACKALGIFSLQRNDDLSNPFSPCDCWIGKKKGFSLDTVGNTCSVGTPDWEYRKTGDGCGIDCHNIDAVVGQVSLYAGLAALLTLAARDIDPK